MYGVNSVMLDRYNMATIKDYSREPVLFVIFTCFHAFGTVKILLPEVKYVTGKAIYSLLA